MKSVGKTKLEHWKKSFMSYESPSFSDYMMWNSACFDDFSFHSICHNKFSRKVPKWSGTVIFVRPCRSKLRNRRLSMFNSSNRWSIHRCVQKVFADFEYMYLNTYNRTFIFCINKLTSLANNILNRSIKLSPKKK